MTSSAAIVLLVLIPAVALAETGGGGGFSFTSCLIQMFASLSIIVGAIYLVSYMSRRWLARTGGAQGLRRYIRIVESRYLAPKKSLLLVEVAGEYLLLSNSNDGLHLIKQIDMLEEVEVVEAAGRPHSLDNSLREKFEELMARASFTRFMSSGTRSVK